MANLCAIAAWIQASYLELQARKNDEGATAVEYGLLVALIAVVIIVGVTAFGNQLNSIFNGLVGKFATP